VFSFVDSHWFTRNCGWATVEFVGNYHKLHHLFAAADFVGNYQN